MCRGLAIGDEGGSVGPFCADVSCAVVPDAGPDAGAGRTPFVGWSVTSRVYSSGRTAPGTRRLARATEGVQRWEDGRRDY